MKRYLFLTLLSLSFSIANASTDIETQAQILDYKQSLERSLSQKASKIAKEKVFVEIELETILSSEKLNEVSKRIDLPLSTLVSEEKGQVFLEGVRIETQSSGILSLETQNRLKSEYTKYFKGIRPVFEFKNIGFSLHNFVDAYWKLAFFGLFFILGLSVGCIQLIKMRTKSNLRSHDLNTLEEEELNYMISNIVKALKQNNQMLREYIQREKPDMVAIKTLMTYIDIHFNLTEILEQDEVQDIKSEKRFYSPREFKIWLSSQFDDIISGSLPALPDLQNNSKQFDFSSLNEAPTDFIYNAFEELNKSELVSFIKSSPDNLKFIAFEFANKNEILPIDELLKNLNNSVYDEFNLEVVQKVSFLVEEQKEAHAA